MVTITDAIGKGKKNRNMVPKMNAAQCKMARAALGLGVREFAELAGVSTDTIARLQRGEELKESTIQRIRAALEKAGVVFIDDNGGGVKLKGR